MDEEGEGLLGLSGCCCVLSECVVGGVDVGVEADEVVVVAVSDGAVAEDGEVWVLDFSHSSIPSMGLVVMCAVRPMNAVRQERRVRYSFSVNWMFAMSLKDCRARSPMLRFGYLRDARMAVVVK